MAINIEKHPADEIAKALSRATGIISSITNCFDAESGQFDLGNKFVFEALANIENMLSNAGANLAHVYERCDLTLLDSPQATDDDEHTEIQPPTDENVDIPHAPDTIPFVGYFGGSTSAERLSQKLDRILEKMPVTEHEQPAMREFLDRPARTYGEFLDKLTAMADAAAYQVHNRHGDNDELLPVLEGLRADVMALKSA